MDAMVPGPAFLLHPWWGPGDEGSSGTLCLRAVVYTSLPTSSKLSVPAAVP